MRLLQHICAAFGRYAVRWPDMRPHRDICGATEIYAVLRPERASSKKEVNKHGHFLLAFGLVAQSVARYAAALRFIRRGGRVCGCFSIYARHSADMRCGGQICGSIAIYAAQPRFMRFYGRSAPPARRK